ncbi:MAG: IclR family transcriptional regulator [Leptothrix sp. (in: b-proteobacteria)]
MPNHPAPTPVAGLVPAVARALAVLDLLAREHRPLSMARVAAALDLPKSSVHGLCSTLLHFGYLRRTGNGALQIGPGVMSLAEAFVSSTSVVSEFDALWREAGTAPDETLILSVLNGAEVVYVGVRNSARPLGLAFNVGMRLPAYLAATGKAMLAFLDFDVVRTLLPPDPLPRLHGEDALGHAELMAELAQTRERGYSIDDGGVHEAIYAIGAPVFDASGQPVAGMAVCLNKAGLSADKLDRQRQIVVQAARRLSRRLGARTENP